MATEMQKKFILIFSDNLGNKKPKSIYKMLLEAGYSETSAHQQSRTLAGINEELETIVGKFRAKRDKAVDFITDKKLKISSAKDLTDIADKLTKNIQLLSNEPTERKKIIIGDEVKKQIEDVIDEL